MHAGSTEPGHLRQVLAYHEMGLVKAPLLLKFYFTDKHPYGLPPTAQGLEMYLSMVPPDVPHLWFIEAKGGAYLPMMRLAVSQGGHVRIGIGDCPLLDGEPVSNAEQVRRFAALARQAGREVATPSEARAMMGDSAAEIEAAADFGGATRCRVPGRRASASLRAIA